MARLLRWFLTTAVASKIAIAVGRDVFRPDSATFIEQLMRIQSESFRAVHAIFSSVVDIASQIARTIRRTRCWTTI